MKNQQVYKHSCIVIKITTHTDKRTISPPGVEKFVNNKKKRKKSSEKLLNEDYNKDFTQKYVEELDEEVVISKTKQNRHKRIDPSAPSESLTKEKKEMIKCSWTKCEIYQGLLMAHMNEHKLVFQCDTCGDKFASESDLNDHIASHRV